MKQQQKSLCRVSNVAHHARCDSQVIIGFHISVSCLVLLTPVVLSALSLFFFPLCLVLLTAVVLSAFVPFFSALSCSTYSCCSFCLFFFPLCLVLLTPVVLSALSFFLLMSHSPDFLQKKFQYFSLRCGFFFFFCMALV